MLGCDGATAPAELGRAADWRRSSIACPIPTVTRRPAAAATESHLRIGRAPATAGGAGVGNRRMRAAPPSTGRELNAAQDAAALADQSPRGHCFFERVLGGGCNTVQTGLQCPHAGRTRARKPARWAFAAAGLATVGGHQESRTSSRCGQMSRFASFPRERKQLPRPSSETTFSCGVSLRLSMGQVSPRNQSSVPRMRRNERIAPEQMYPDSGFGEVQHGRHVACRVSLELTQYHDCTLSRRKQIRPPPAVPRGRSACSRVVSGDGSSAGRRSSSSRGSQVPLASPAGTNPAVAARS